MLDETYDKKILVVNEQSVFLNGLVITLKKCGFQIETSNCVSEAYKTIGQLQDEIKVIICDNSLSEISGYGFFKNLKINKNNHDLLTVLVDSEPTYDNKVQKNESGVDVFLSSSNSLDEFITEIKMHLSLKEQNVQLKKELTDANTIAMSALTYSSELGRVVNFYEEAISASTYSELADKLFKLTRSYNLKCSLFINNGHDKIYFTDTDEEISLLEKKLFQHAIFGSRFVDFGSRTLINYPNFSLLIKNMPVEDVNRYGVLKDIAGAFCNSFYAKLELLIAEENNFRQRNKFFEVLRDAIDTIDQSITGIQCKNMEIIEDASEQIEHSIMFLELHEKKEEELMNIMGQCLQKSHENFVNGVKLDKIFSHIRKKIDGAMNTPSAINSEPVSNVSSCEPEFF